MSIISFTKTKRKLTATILLSIFFCSIIIFCFFNQEIYASSTQPPKTSIVAKNFESSKDLASGNEATGYSLTDSEEDTNSLFAQDIDMVGDGTQNSPYQVKTKSDLLKIWNDLDAHYIMMNDIIFTTEDFAENGAFYDYGVHPDTGIHGVYGYGLEPIGDGANPFTGVFDGNSYSIIGLYEEIDTSFMMWMGLFGYVENAVVKNLNVLDVNITTASNTNIFTGAVAGYILNSTIENCTVSGNIIGDNYVGGIVGYLGENSSVIDCTNNASVLGLDSDYSSFLDENPQEFVYAGGIVGTVGSIPGAMEGGLVKNCVNNTQVSATVSGAHGSVGYAAGIVGNLYSGIVTGCVNNGDISSTVRSDANDGTDNVNTYAAGIVGKSEISSIINCTNTASIYSKALESSATSAGIVANDTWTLNGVCDISGTINRGEVFATAPDSITIGGISGLSSGNIHSSHNSGTISGVVSGDRAIFAEVGGIVGNTTGSITTSYNTADISVTKSETSQGQRYFRIGGIVGRIFNGVGVSDCFNTGNVTATDPLGTDSSYVYVGGIAGMTEAVSITNSYNIGIITSDSYPCGGVGQLLDDRSVFENIYSSNSSRLLRVVYPMSSSDLSNYNWRLDDTEMQDQTNFVGFDFAKTWTMQGDANYHYPELRVFNIDDISQISAISIATYPTKLSYGLGDELDLASGEIAVEYTDGNTITIAMTKDMVTGFDINTVGTQTLTVNYNGFSTTFQISMKTVAEHIDDQLKDILVSFPQDEIWSEEQKSQVATLIGDAAKILNKTSIEDARSNANLSETISLLEEMLIKYEPKLSVVSSLPIVEEGVSADTTLPAIGVKVDGLAFAVKGGGSTGKPFPTFWETPFTLEVTQKALSDSQSADTISLKILPKMIFSWDSETIANFELYSPVSFKLYLNDNFSYASAKIEHITRDANKPVEVEYFTVPVQSDEDGKFIHMTVSQFSEFNITGSGATEVSPKIIFDVTSDNENEDVTFEIFAVEDTAHETPLYTTTFKSNNYSGEGALNSSNITLNLDIDPGTYDIVLSKNSHLNYVIKGVTLTSATNDFTTNSNVLLQHILMKSGDVNADGIINFNDVAITRNTQSFNKSVTDSGVNILSDINGDSIIDSSDLSIIMNHYNLSTEDTTITYTP